MERQDRERKEIKMTTATHRYETRGSGTLVARQVPKFIGHIGKFGYIDKSSMGVEPENPQKDSYTFVGRERFDEMNGLMSQMPGYIPVASEHYPNNCDVRELVSVTGIVGDCAVNLVRNTSHNYTHLIIANEEPSKRKGTLRQLEVAFA